MYKVSIVAVALAAVSATVVDAQTLKQGSRGEQVRRVQRALVLHGNRIALDGIYGPNTAAAVKAFQRSRGLPGTGRVDAVTLRALERPIQRGDQGAAVRQLQRQLNANGARISEDGKFGPNTESALEAFQRSMGLGQSGKLDSSTLSKLLGAARGNSSGTGESGGGSGTLAAGRGGAPRSRLIEQAKQYIASNPRGFKKNVLVVVDFTKRSSEKRLFIVDTRTNKVEAWKTAHGSGSDPGNTGRPTRFSNRSGSKMSSIGFYRTAETYQGKYGYSLRLDGLSGTNSRVRARAVVMHPSKYVREGGASGRSWGCFAIDSRYSRHIIDRVKGGVLLYAYGGQR